MIKSSLTPCLARFHCVDSALWHQIDHFLWSLVYARIDAASNVLSLRVTLSDCDALTEFQSQMALSYVHPRRDSFHLMFPSANPFVCSASVPVSLEKKKNLSL